MAQRCSARGIVTALFLLGIEPGLHAGPAPEETPARLTAEEVRALEQLTSAQRRALRVDATVRAVARVRPSVIAIATARKVASSNPLREVGEEAPTETRIGIGSGVIVDARGYAVTNAHVVAGATTILVRLHDGREAYATVIGQTPEFDLAVLRIQRAGPFPVAALGTANDLLHGETVIAIGTPFGLTSTVSKGIVSAVGRSFTVKNRTFAEFLQIDAAVNPGNSGGPLVNLLGEVVGINTAVHSGGPGIGFAIPIDRARAVVNDLLTLGYVRGVYLGLSVAVRPAGGLRVKSVEPGSPASTAGLLPGDVIVSWKGDSIDSLETFRAAAAAVIAGHPISVRLHRGTVTLVPTLLTPERARWVLGIRLGVVVDLATRHAKRLGPAAGSGVVILSITKGQHADNAELQVNDVIEQLGGFPTRDLVALGHAAARTAHVDTVSVVFRRGKDRYRTSYTNR